MKALAIALAFAAPSTALAQEALSQVHPRISCVAVFRQECAAGGSRCRRGKTDARWDIDLARKVVRYRNADFSERIVALVEHDAFTEAALLDSGRLLRFHQHDEAGLAFDASLLETLNGKTFALTRFNCRSQRPSTAHPGESRDPS